MRTLFAIFITFIFTVLIACGTGGNSNDSGKKNAPPDPGIETSAQDVSTSEGGSQSVLFINATAAPASGELIVVDISSDDETEGTVLPAQITFDETDWQTQKSFNIVPADDNIYDGAQTYHVTLGTSASTDPEYASLEATVITVQNADDETGFAAQGSVASPIDITGKVPYEGMVDNTTSYYRFETTLSEIYEVTLSGGTETLNLEAYPDGLSGGVLPRPNIAPGETDTFLFVAWSSELIIKINNSSETGGSNFVINITHIPSTLYYIETFPSSIGSDANTSIEVWDEDNILWATDLIDNIDPYARTWCKFISGKTYFIKVQDETNAGGHYSIIITDSGFGASSSGTAASLDLYEPDDDFLNSTALTLDTIQDHSLYPAGDTDWFVFTAP